MQITPIPLLSDNYAWLLTSQNDCAVIDPSEAAPVARLIRGLNLRAILATHHHHDHVGGIEKLLPAEVFCSQYDFDQQRIPGASTPLKDNQTFELLGQNVHCLSVPGHTLGAVAYYLSSENAVFTGDTLFLAGCGRLFEGTPAQMFASLNRLKQLPKNTRIFCGHEYTEKNLRFAANLDPQNKIVSARLKEVQAQRQKDQPTVPAALEIELQTNPFLQAEDLETFTEYRKLRDGF